MKKSFSIILALVITLITAFAFGISVSAVGVDDGVLAVTTKNGKKYLGTKKSDFCTEFIAANGDSDKFYRYEKVDINNDGETDISDLVALNKNPDTDLNFDSSVDADDLAVMRKILIGITDMKTN